MNFNDLTNRLSEKQKERLRNAKSQEDLDKLFTPDKLLLTEDQLGEVAARPHFPLLCLEPPSISISPWISVRGDFAS